MLRLRHGGRRARSLDRAADRRAEKPCGGYRPKACPDCGGAAGIELTAFMTIFEAAHSPSSRADGSRECAPDDRLREVICQSACGKVDCFRLRAEALRGRRF